LPRRRAAGLYIVSKGLEGLFFWAVVALYLLYHHDVAGLNPFQMVILGTVLETCVFFLEVPTGVVADRVSRRLSMAIGYLLMGAGLIIEGCFPIFWVLLAAQPIWGAGATFVSGASEAWLADELICEGRGDRLQRVLLRANQLYQLGALIGIIAAVVLATHWSLGAPIVIGGVGIAGLGLLVMLVFPERGFQRPDQGEAGAFAGMWVTLQQGIGVARESGQLRRILWIAFFIGAFSEALDRLWVVHLRQNHDLPDLPWAGDLFWFASVPAVSMVLTMIVTEAMQRREINDERSLVRFMGGVIIVISAGVIGFALVPVFWLALVLYWSVSAARISVSPLFTSWINQHAPSEIRATVISARAQADALGQVSGGPGRGWVGLRGSVRMALALAGTFLFPAIGLFIRAARSAHRSPVTDDASDGIGKPP